MKDAYTKGLGALEGFRGEGAEEGRKKKRVISGFQGKKST